MTKNIDLSDDEDEYLSSDDDTVDLKNVEADPIDDRGWDVFRVLPPEQDGGSAANQKCMSAVMKTMRAISYIVTFVVVLGSAGISKSTLLFMTSQVRAGAAYPWCNDKDLSLVAELPVVERVAWTWCIFFVFSAPEVFAFGRSLRMVFFKNWKTPELSEFFLFLSFETLHTIGVAMFVFMVLPEFDAFKGAMLTNAACLIPAILCMLARNRKEKHRGWRYILDILSILAQILALILWPLEKALYPNGNVANSDTIIWALPVSLVLVSCGWWENYVDKNSPVGLVKWLGEFSAKIGRKRYFIQMFATAWKIIVFFSSMLMIWTFHIQSGMKPFPAIESLFTNFVSGFGQHNITIQVTNNNSIGSVLSTDPPQSENLAPMNVLLIQIATSLGCYIFGKFACRVTMQGFAFALPLNLTVPSVLTFIMVVCGLYEKDQCAFKGVFPNYLFFQCPSGPLIDDVIFLELSFLWFLWFMSQVWVTLHIWTPRCERLASTEKLFLNPYYSGIFVDQSMSMNRKRDDEILVRVDELELEGEVDVGHYLDDDNASVTTDSSKSAAPRIMGSDTITRIYACATLWHEEKGEMVEYLKSVFRMDEDQSVRRIAQKYLRIVDPDYYEYETHIFFDDAFQLADDADEHVVNNFVKDFMSVVDEAATHVHGVIMRIRAPKKVPTPYGGRLIYTLPGKTKIIVHLKDKDKIRHKKRWSQCMYMYYLLGYKLMDQPIDVHRKEVIAANTYLLALDGDVDFQPEAVRLLVDLMKKNQKLGAACGRIHPTGSAFEITRTRIQSTNQFPLGPMVWYQKFEYAIGHWLQKATEHVIGCVLCSPGCFSLFRAKALMDDNVMKMYTTVSSEARHYVQFDQGEDRWLCTLILQRGYRVEYCAASDAYTHAPEGFNEFYNQRRRWVPSTMANIFDLLNDAVRAVKVNENLSTPYIGYQAFLLLGTVLGPGTIFLMIVGAFNAAFGMDIMYSFVLNLVPILLFMLACYFLKQKWQLTFAQVLSTIYALVMMAVLVGMIKQMITDGLSSPSGIFFIASALSFIIAALLHPQEFWCLPCGLVYYLTVPSMYLLLIIYSLFNMNDVSWGTREAPVKKTKEQLEAEQREAERAKKEAKEKSMLAWLHTKKQDDEEGSIEFNLANLIRIACCTYKKPQDQQQQLMRIAETLEDLKKKLDKIERVADPLGGLRRRSTGRLSIARTLGQPLDSLQEGDENDEEIMDEMYEKNDMDSESSESVIEPEVERDDLKNPYWLEDRDLRKGQVDFLPGREIAFFKELIERYLMPLNKDAAHQKKVAQELRALRDSIVFSFFIINALYVVGIFFFQINKELIYVEWPWGATHNITYEFPSGSTPTVKIETEKLQLEPIGLVFVIFYFAVMVIQFIAMFIHRISTFSHMVSSYQLSFCTKRVEDVSEEAFLEKKGVDIVRNLGALRGIAGDDESDDESVSPERRKTIHNLHGGGNRFTKKKQIVSVEDAFRKRFMSISANGDSNDPVLRRLSMRRETLRALEERRNTIISVEQRRMSQIRMSMSADSGRMSMSETTKGDRSSVSYYNNGAYEEETKED